jgi:hypothetical protein
MLPWRRLSTLSGIALLGLLAAAFVACTGQGENERCSLERGGATGGDCQDGLVCVLSSVLGQNADVCCPIDEKARTGICAGKGTPTSDSGTADTATADTATADTATADTATADTATADTATADTADAAASETSATTDAADAG